MSYPMLFLSTSAINASNVGHGEGDYQPNPGDELPATLLGADGGRLTMIRQESPNVWIMRLAWEGARLDGRLFKLSRRTTIIQNGSAYEWPCSLDLIPLAEPPFTAA
jgi:hypothetical protein